jgi:hypothetical protein
VQVLRKFLVLHNFRAERVVLSQCMLRKISI